MKQTDRIIDYIGEFGSITPLEAFRDLGIMRLASRISDLKKEGYDIQSEMASGTNRYGETTHFKKYWL